MPYLMLRSATAFTGFVKTVFNATQSFSRMREDGTTLMHGEVQVNGSTIMFCDVTSDWEEANANLFVYVDNADEVFAKAIEAGASVVMELRDESYGRTCGVKDPVGNTWWITSVA